MVSGPWDAQPHQGAGFLEALEGESERQGNWQEKVQPRAKRPMKRSRFAVGLEKVSHGEERGKRWEVGEKR